MREYDIFLKGRLVEADIIISKLPYRVGISVSNRLVLEYLLKELLVHKFIAAQNNLSIVSEIDSMKTAYETMNHGVGLVTSITENKQVSDTPDNIEIQIDCAVEARVGRYRKLYELDNLKLSDIDSMTLGEIDFIEA